MQNNELCYSYDSANKTISVVKLQTDHMNAGYMPKPPNTLYIDPSTIALEENETLRLSEDTGNWEKIPHHIGKKLYHKANKSEMTITEVGESPNDYPDYTERQLSGNAPYYSFSESEKNWVFDLEKYKSDASNRVTDMCIKENHNMLPQHKRDNIYAGSPASDNYPAYLKGEAGKATIAQLNAVYQSISEQAKSGIQSAMSQEEIDNILSGIIFPNEIEILALISI